MSVFWIAVDTVVLGALVFGLAVGFATRSGQRRLRGQGGGFLCDRCKYNDVRYCSLPDRPNATKCPEFKSK